MSSDEETEQISSWKGIPATLICINIYGPCKAYSAQVAHTATCRMMRQYLRRASSQLIGVCVYGTEGSNTSVLSIQTVEEIFPLSSPSVDAYNKLRKIDISKLKEAKEMTLSDVLWYCNKAFASCKKQLSTRTVIMLSRLDIPPVPTDVKPSLKRVADLVDSNIQINLINISESDYEVDPYYTNFLIQATKEDEVIIPKPISNHTELEQLMYMESHRNLAVARLSFEIGKDFAIGVGVYNLLKSYGDTQMKKSDLDSDTNAVLTSVNKTLKSKVGNNEEEMDVDEQDKTESRPVPLLQSELLYSLQYGDENIEFTAEEKKMLGNPFGPPTLKLLGFKPNSVMRKEKWYLKSNYFLFPSESIIEGSVVAFKALHQACTEMNKVAICVLCTRVNARPIIVALSPTSRPCGLNVDLGFDVIRIPFVENVRNIPIIEDDDDDEKISKTDKGIMKDILNQLKFDYKPDMFQNPKRQSLYNAIEAIALEDDDVEPFIDTTKPDAKRFEGLQDDLFYEVFGPFAITSRPLKNPASSSGGPESKKAKLSVSVDEELLKERLENNAIENYTVAQLKDILRYKEIPHLPAMTGMRKGELVDLVYKYC
ncbi:unnamed protein product [Spodoptera littoralis]|uniref:Ku domain-containing protein n=1 Tax=Spodoptera littoralis TaxID=7109 RepID=A0A9P0I6K9_SPOLI|nr:unnamed protein product [Spodoptera littoralis]CAH1640350.1 unnamed protein product [Spodoptera littoralis]